MAEFVRVKLENGSEKSVTVERAKALGLTPLKKQAVNRRGEPLKTKHQVDLTGAALNQALKDAGLPTSGTAQEKRYRLSEHQASASSLAVGTTPSNPTGSNASASPTED